MDRTGIQQANGSQAERERLLWVLAAATFIIFFQAFMVAPLIPHLSRFFEASPRITGLVVPAYLIPYGFATLVYGLLSDRLGIRRLVLGSMVALILFSIGTATAQSIEQLIAWRVATAIAARGETRCSAVAV